MKNYFEKTIPTFFAIFLAAGPPIGLVACLGILKLMGPTGPHYPAPPLLPLSVRVFGLIGWLLFTYISAGIPCFIASVLCSLQISILLSAMNFIKLNAWVASIGGLLAGADSGFITMLIVELILSQSAHRPFRPWTFWTAGGAISGAICGLISLNMIARAKNNPGETHV